MDRDAASDRLHLVDICTLSEMGDRSIPFIVSNSSQSSSVQLPSFRYIQSKCSNLLLGAVYSAGFQGNALVNAVHRDQPSLHIAGNGRNQNASLHCYISLAFQIDGRSIQ
jgi:hypothetical protein